MSFDHPRPLVVCGYVRSGTRMCANVLANSNHVELQGEIPPTLARPTLTWLDAMSAAWGPCDALRSYRLSRTTFRTVAKSRPIKRPDALWFGHKTPRHEQHFGLYEAIFNHPEARPHYVYCLRNPFHVWRSYRSVPWSNVTDVREFLESWNRSVEEFEGMKGAAPDRVHLFNLDAMLAASDRLSWLKGAMLDRLGIGEETFRKPVELLKNSNSMEAKFGASPTEPPPEEMAAIARDRRARRAIAGYFPQWEAHASELAANRARRLFRR